jgi:phosphoribosylanthranilate isomerase
LDIKCVKPNSELAKICGITRTQDIDAVVQAGADAIGLVFFPPSPRHVSIEQAQIWQAQYPLMFSWLVYL